ncbi:MAG: hypothetical protein A2622_00055 [Bdellovibrionales bacterium RIFCSPHIGHO2_01_FULL_40_29]|nr:MAG: hypothetical protein A2622_00055 [Bdellovibrionales bacterium RIFCSPHIGHO2_01_FULL_40_29]OFZ32520.1 MAG: hypothetical protein A3D17_04655 [Bdellovibrionales bacterium RIFCSPHIGHO2_02_FULL_40_15]
MKYLILLTSLLLSVQSFSEETQDLSKTLTKSRCNPVRSADGTISEIKCDGELGQKQKGKEFQQVKIKDPNSKGLKSGDKIITKNGKPIDSIKKSMELYHSMKSTDQITVERGFSISKDLKSCLATIYSGQVSYHIEIGAYTTMLSDLNINQAETCKGLELFIDYANQTEFKATAKSNDEVWTVDQTKTILEVR